MAFRKDLTGQKFGMLTVLHVDEEFEKIKNGRNTRWICQCDCGTIKSIIGTELTKKNKSQKSCGCLLKQRNKNFGKITFKDLTNQRFGMLIAKEKIDTDKYGYAIWKCQCDCGNECEITSRELLAGDTISCGCQKGAWSYWEDQIAQQLTNNNIIFKREYRFNDLKDIFHLRFDFAIFDQQNNLLGLIEYQGEQHSNINNPLYNESIVKHDIMKKQYCQEKRKRIY